MSRTLHCLLLSLPPSIPPSLPSILPFFTNFDSYLPSSFCVLKGGERIFLSFSLKALKSESSQKPDTVPLGWSRDRGSRGELAGRTASWPDPQASTDIGVRWAELPAQKWGRVSRMSSQALALDMEGSWAQERERRGSLNPCWKKQAELGERQGMCLTLSYQCDLWFSLWRDLNF